MRIARTWAFAAVLSIAGLAGCASTNPEPLTPAARPVPIKTIQDRAYRWGFDSGRRVERQSLAKDLRVSADITTPCPLPGSGLVRDRAPTESELRTELGRVLDLYRACARDKDASDATILWLLGEIRHGE